MKTGKNAMLNVGNMLGKTGKRRSGRIDLS
jgi:hypothetical protein